MKEKTKEFSVNSVCIHKLTRLTKTLYFCTECRVGMNTDYKSKQSHRRCFLSEDEIVPFLLGEITHTEIAESRKNKSIYKKPKRRQVNGLFEHRK